MPRPDVLLTAFLAVVVFAADRLAADLRADVVDFPDCSTDDAVLFLLLAVDFPALTLAGGIRVVFLNDPDDISGS